MVKTKTSIFCQRLNVDVQHLMHLQRLLEVWNQSEDEFDELMLEAGLDVIDRIDNVLRDMQSLSSREWSTLYNAQQAPAEPKSRSEAKPEASTEAVALAAGDSDMPEDFAVTGCKEGE